MKMLRSPVLLTMPRSFLRIFSAACVAAFSLHAEEEKKTAVAPKMREVSPGIYEIGKIRLDKSKRTLSFPAKVNMVEGNIEYVICTARGSTHESVIATEVDPSDIHFGMLLLDAKGAGILAPAPGDAPPTQIDAEYLKGAPRLKGDSITLTAKWKDASGKEGSAAVEDWVLNEKDNKPAARGPWIYTGSMFAENEFLAQLQGNVASIVSNPGALINNPRKGSDNDQIWVVNTKAIPPVETPIEVTIKLEPAPETKPK
jgi:hypothetical protein